MIFILLLLLLVLVLPACTFFAYSYSLSDLTVDVPLDGKCLSALTLYRQLKMEGRLDEPDEDDDEAAASASDGGQDSDDSGSLQFDFGSNWVHNADEMLIDRNEASPHTGACTINRPLITMHD